MFVIFKTSNKDFVSTASYILFGLVEMFSNSTIT